MQNTILSTEPFGREKRFSIFFFFTNQYKKYERPYTRTCHLVEFQTGTVPEGLSSKNVYETW